MASGVLFCDLVLHVSRARAGVGSWKGDRALGRGRVMAAFRSDSKRSAYQDLVGMAMDALLLYQRLLRSNVLIYISC